MKKKYIPFLVVGILLLAALIYGLVNPAAKKNSAVDPKSVFAVKKGNLKQVVNLSGQVKSQNREEIYAAGINAPIKEILFKVGDEVNAGDVVARMETSELDTQIRQAELNLDNAKLTLSKERDEQRFAKTSATSNLEMAKKDLDAQKDAYNDIREKVDEDKLPKDQLDQAKLARDKAQIAYDNAQNEVDRAKKQSTEQSENNVKIQEEILSNLKAQLAKAEVKATVKGTVSEVPGIVGSVPQGAILIINDLSSLYVESAVNEYEVANVKAGQGVEIKADSLGDATVQGKVESVAPAPSSNQPAMPGAGAAPSSAENVEYATKIIPSGDLQGLKIGMNVRLNVLQAEKKEVLYVPFEALVEQEDGSFVVQVPDLADASKEPKLVPVKRGIETNQYVEISGQGITSGTNVYSPAKAKAK